MIQKAAAQIIHPHHLMALEEQMAADMGANEAGRAGDQYL